MTEHFIETLGEALVVDISEDIVYSSILKQVFLNACNNNKHLSHRQLLKLKTNYEHNIICHSKIPSIRGLRELTERQVINAVRCVLLAVRFAHLLHELTQREVQFVRRARQYIGFV